jgi:hypothetical protein
MFFNRSRRNKLVSNKQKEVDNTTQLSQELVFKDSANQKKELPIAAMFFLTDQEEISISFK